jgi:hypothetical protein
LWIRRTRNPELRAGDHRRHSLRSQAGGAGTESLEQNGAAVAVDHIDDAIELADRLSADQVSG